MGIDPRIWLVVMFQCFSCFPVLSEGAQKQEGDSHHQGDDLFVAISPGQFPRAIEDYVAVIFMEASFVK